MRRRARTGRPAKRRRAPPPSRAAEQQRTPRPPIPPVRSSVRRLIRPSQFPVSPMRAPSRRTRRRRITPTGWSQPPLRVPQDVARSHDAALQREPRQRRALAGAAAAPRSRTARTARGDGTSRSPRSGTARQPARGSTAASRTAAAANGRHSATSTRRWAALSCGAGPRTPATVLPPPLASGAEYVSARPPDARCTSPCAQRTAAVHALAVDVRAVARAAVVDERPDVPDALDVRVRARDLVVPRQRDVAGRLAPDAERRVRGAELDDPLPVGTVAVHEERRSAPLGVQTRLAARSARTGGGRGDRVHGPNLPARRSVIESA